MQNLTDDIIWSAIQSQRGNSRVCVIAGREYLSNHACILRQHFGYTVHSPCQSPCILFSKYFRLEQNSKNFLKKTNRLCVNLVKDRKSDGYDNTILREIRSKDLGEFDCSDSSLILCSSSSTSPPSLSCPQSRSGFSVIFIIDTKHRLTDFVSLY